MSNEWIALVAAAASIGFTHTLLGPDHYIPFIVMAKAHQWSYRKTVWVTLLCGLGHIGSAVVLGLLGTALGILAEKLELIESVRSSWAAWALIAFGLVYFVYGIRKIFQKTSHKDTIFHQSDNAYKNNILARSVPWTLFVIFVLGPCEPLIPLMIYPSVQQDIQAMLLVVSVFGGITIATMLGIVLVSTFGLNIFWLRHLERYTHAFAGAAILLCGYAIQFLGL